MNSEMSDGDDGIDVWGEEGTRALAAFNRDCVAANLAVSDQLLVTMTSG